MKAYHLLFLLFFTSCSAVEKEVEHKKMLKDDIYSFIDIDKIDSIMLECSLLPKFETSSKGRNIYVSLDLSQTPIAHEKLLKDFVVGCIQRSVNPNYPKFDSLYFGVSLGDNAKDKFLYSCSEQDLKITKEELNESLKYFKLLSYLVANRYYTELKAFAVLMERWSDVGDEDYHLEYNYDFLNLSEKFLKECKQADYHWVRMYMCAMTTSEAKTARLLQIINKACSLCELEFITKSMLEDDINGDSKDRLYIEWDDYDSTKFEPPQIQV